MASRPDITELLAEAGRGEDAAAEELARCVYDELHALASRFLSHERPDHTLQPTALVNEAYLRLADQKRTSWQNRAHYYKVASRVMRRILVDHARRHRAAKRGGGAERMSMTAAASVGVEATHDLVALDEALAKLAAFDPEKARVVELRFFGGLTGEETARVLEVSTRTVDRAWRMARAWLFHELTKGDCDGSPEVASDRDALRGGEQSPGG